MITRHYSYSYSSSYYFIVCTVSSGADIVRILSLADLSIAGMREYRYISYSWRTCISISKMMDIVMMVIIVTMMIRCRIGRRDIV